MMLLDSFGFFGWIYGKMDEISKSGQFRGLTSRRRDPRSSVSPSQGVACPRRGAAEREAWISLRYIEA